ncbi:MAG: hypothetical protein JWQ74_1396 [Marmoricola sp.]|nr:hypothetical protein [Marmoricola sp.]
MAKSKSNPGDDKRRARISRQVTDIVNEIVLSTADEDVEVAIDKLHARLQRVGGQTFDRSWAKRAVETMRRGDVFKIVIT